MFLTLPECPMPSGGIDVLMRAYDSFTPIEPVEVTINCTTWQHDLQDTTERDAVTPDETEARQTLIPPRSIVVRRSSHHQVHTVMAAILGE
jgi:hypothetical protein